MYVDMYLCTDVCLDVFVCVYVHIALDLRVHIGIDSYFDGARDIHGTESPHLCSWGL